MKTSKNISIVTLLGAMAFSAAAFASERVGYVQTDLEKFNATHQCPGCDLSAATIKGNYSSANLKNANLSESQFAGDFSQTNFSKANLSNTSFIGASMSEAKFNHALLLNTDLSVTDLSLSDFTDAQVIGVNFAAANLYGAKITPEQLAKARSVCGATLPDGSTGKC